MKLIYNNRIPILHWSLSLLGTSSFAPIPRLAPQTEPRSLGIPPLNTPTIGLAPPILPLDPPNENMPSVWTHPEGHATLGRRNMVSFVEEEGDVSKTRSLGRPQVQYNQSWDLNAAADYLRDSNNADSCV